MQEQPVRGVELLDAAGGGGGFLDGERLALAGGRHEAQHHEVGVGIEENVLDEGVRAEALEVVQRSGQGRGGAAVGGKAAEGPRALGQGLEPGPGRVHEVALHIEDELVAGHAGRGGVRVQAGLGGELVEAAAAAGGGVGLVHRQQGGGRRRRSP